MLQGSGECAKVDWTLLGFSMPEWTLLCFVLLAIGALNAGFRSQRRTRFTACCRSPATSL